MPSKKISESVSTVCKTSITRQGSDKISTLNCIVFQGTDVRLKNARQHQLEEEALRNCDENRSGKDALKNWPPLRKRADQLQDEASGTHNQKNNYEYCSGESPERLQRQRSASVDSFARHAAIANLGERQDRNNNAHSSKDGLNSAPIPLSENVRRLENNVDENRTQGMSDRFVLSKPHVMASAGVDDVEVNRVKISRSKSKSILGTRKSSRTVPDCNNAEPSISALATARIERGTECQKPELHDKWRTYLFMDDNGIGEEREAQFSGRRVFQHGITSRTVRKTRERKPMRFSSLQIECLVRAVEKFGVGRWRDVKENYFSLVRDLSAGDLKDKWRSLVHSAQLAPRYRRCLKLSPLLAKRILSIDGEAEK